VVAWLQETVERAMQIEFDRLYRGCPRRWPDSSRPLPHPDTAPTPTGGVAQLSRPGGLNKLGSNALALAAANTYTGNATISGGTLTLASGGSLLLDVGEAANSRISQQDSEGVGIVQGTATPI
jgi:autotransporter-associated beta strand protein